MAIVGGVMILAVLGGIMFGNKGDAAPYLILGIVGLALVLGAVVDQVMG